MTGKFRGKIGLDVRESVPDWTPFRESPAPEGAPNVLLVLYDDTGLAAWSPYGDRINMPTMQKLADNHAAAKSDWKTQPGHFALCGEGLNVGLDSSDPVSKEYDARFAFTGERIRVVEVNIGEDFYLDLEREFHAAMARDYENGDVQTATRRDGMVLVPGGRTVLGARRRYPEELPVREMVVSDLWVDEHPVTNEEFARFAGETGHVTVAETAPDAADFPDADPALLVPGSQLFSQTPGPVSLGDWTQWWRWQEGTSWRTPQGPGTRWNDVLDHPVVHVGWEDAQAFASWSGKRLASEDEWEHAARGGLDGRDYAWGDELHPDGQVLANTWQGPFPWRSEDARGHHRTSPVGSYPPNGFGLLDTIGNVWEWTSTPGQNQGGGHPCCGGATAAVVETDRFVMKGGSHLCSPHYCRRYRPGARQLHGARDTTSHLGFRCVRSA